MSWLRAQEHRGRHGEVRATFPELGAGQKPESLSDKVPADILLTDDHTLLVKWLCRFRTEACKLDG